MQNTINSITSDVIMTHQTQTFPLIISDKLEKKIRVLCNQFPSTEWSGQLFYTYKGSFAQNNIEFTAEDLLFMDIGDATTTEFYLNEGNTATYIADHELWDCQIGLIHSHHSMQAFFSGQDDAMLVQEGTTRNHFLSLVVNNQGQYVARITLKEEQDITSTVKRNYHTFNNVEIETSMDNVHDSRVIVNTYDLNIVKNNSLLCDDYEELMNTIEECNKRKEKKKKEKEIQNNNNIVFDFPRNIPTQCDFIEDTDRLSEKEIQQYIKQLLSLNPLVNDSVDNLVKKLDTDMPKRFNPEEYKYIMNIYCDYLLDTEIALKFDKKYEDPDISYEAYIQAKEDISKALYKLNVIYPNNNYLKILYNYTLQ